MKYSIQDGHFSQQGSVRVLFVLLSGLFFVCAFRVLYFFAVWAGGVFYFMLFGRGRGPRPNSKKKNDTARTAKKKQALAPSERAFVAVWAGGREYVFAVWAVGVFLFCCLGGCRFFFLAVWAGACVCVCFFFFFAAGGAFIVFAVWARGVFFLFCCLGGGREFTHLPVCLARLQAAQQQKRPNSKKTKTCSNRGPPPKRKGSV